MRFLMVGAGALGGYYGGGLQEAGCDVTFLVRPRRAAQLQASGLVIRSRLGDVDLPTPAHVLAEEINAPFDVVVVGCKAYDLDQAMDSFAPAVGPDTVILPLLNGMAHLDRLAQRFGAARVLGGQSVASVALDAEGTVLHMNDHDNLSFGELDGSRSARVQAIEAQFDKAKFHARASENIRQEMWEKWMFVAAGASLTCLMRAPVGDIVEGGGRELALALIDECVAIATQCGYPPGDAAVTRARTLLTQEGSLISASMLRDMERGRPIEADHIVGDFLARRGGEGREVSLLRVAYVHLKAYEARRRRETAAV